ncbi:hypothetical protein LCGC14_0788790 [marine sediment metagenome]|uniref:Uncharacterized protein n=1 Tax=marine sediment metagenome TaxID=412755 RepID=A0A0F9T0C2_9ZZZZ
MSTKAALILGDYTNGWSDSIQVQVVTNIKEVKQFSKDRDFVTMVMSTHLNDVVRALEANEKLNPTPKDEACCANFKEWAGKQGESCDIPFCPYCQKGITDERRKKFFKGGE